VRWLVLILLASIAAGCVVAFHPSESHATGSPGTVPPPPPDWHTVVTQPGPGGVSDTPAPPAPPPAPVCGWVRGTTTQVNAGIQNSGISGQIIRETADDHVLLVRECNGVWDGRTYQWLVPITAADLARDGLVELSGRLPNPAVITTPADGTASIATLPVFVAVDSTQWASIEVTRTDPLTGLSATAVATPTTMTFDPGDGSGDQACDGPGIGYDPSIGDGNPNTQAALAGRCTHAYTRITVNADHSPVAGRPHAWPATITVTWNVTWTATNGESGQFAPIPKTTGFDRPVTEVQALVTASH
jgi:hypothetical protein